MKLRVLSEGFSSFAVDENDDLWIRGRAWDHSRNDLEVLWLRHRPAASSDSAEFEWERQRAAGGGCARLVDVARVDA